VQTHGTHVSGIIGARPPADSSDFAGIAPGCDLYVGRIFTETGGGNQGDVANAIDALCEQHSADIINMSLMGAPSSIEHDAIILAFEKGAVCVCAAGNQDGSPAGSPAAYPQSIAVSALGLPNTAPLNSMPALNTPAQPDRFGYGAIFLATFSNIGPHILCMAPGNGIISTIPANKHDPAPYADMSGTSMAAPFDRRHPRQTAVARCAISGDAAQYGARCVCEDAAGAPCIADRAERRLSGARYSARSMRRAQSRLLASQCNQLLALIVRLVLIPQDGQV
jgi:subtilisin family serine protease